MAPIKVPTIDFPSLVTRSVTRTESEGLEPLNSPGTIDLTGAEIPDGRSKPGTPFPNIAPFPVTPLWDKGSETREFPLDPTRPCVLGKGNETLALA